MSEVLVKVSLDELMYSPKLEFNLYRGNGQMLYIAGTELSRHELSEIKSRGAYRDWHNLPLNHEGNIIPFPAQPLTEQEREALATEEAALPLYGEALSEEMFQAIQGFWLRMGAGDTPDIALCELIRDKLVAELTSKADQLQYLSQLRVRDHYTYSHTLNVAALSIALAKKADYSQQDIRDIGLAAILHDLGKLFIPKAIMFKTTRLTEKEFEVMKLHPGLGYQVIVEKLHLPEHIGRPALEHQEMYAGGGYPQNIKGDEIHPLSQIVKVADVYEALTARRPYKDSIPSGKAIQIMLSEGAKSFNPELLAHFVEMANYEALPAPVEILQ